MNAPLNTLTRNELETLVGDVVALHLRLESLRAQMEQEIATIRQRHSNDLTNIERELAEKRAYLHLWAEDNREAFGAKKSLDCHHATVGFRAGPPRIERVKSDASWDHIAQKLGRLAWGANYLRTPPPEPEVNKEALLADRHKLGRQKLHKAGLRIVQEERFYIAPRILSAKNLLRAAA